MQHSPATYQRRRQAAPSAELYVKCEPSTQAHPQSTPKRPPAEKTHTAPASNAPKQTMRRKKPAHLKPKTHRRDTTGKSNLQDGRRPRKQAT